MKRYRIEKHQVYADDEDFVADVAVEDANGNWVPAEVAQGLYDALRSCSEWDGLPPHLQSKADAALAAADGVDDG